MKKRLLPIALLLLPTMIGLSSCLSPFDPGEKQEITWDHFATGFITESKMEARYDPTSKAIYLAGFDKPKDNRNAITLLDGGKKSEIAAYADSFGDKLEKPVTYTGYTNSGGVQIPFFVYYANPVVSIDVTSDIDWDDDLPKGSSLNSQFAYFTGCADRFAKEHKTYERQERPDEYPLSENYFYRNTLDNNFRNQDGITLFLYGLLSDLDLTGRDYVGITSTNVFMLLATDNLKIQSEQTLSIKVTFRDETEYTISLPVNKLSE